MNDQRSEDNFCVYARYFKDEDDLLVDVHPTVEESMASLKEIRKKPEIVMGSVASQKNPQRVIYYFGPDKRIHDQNRRPLKKGSAFYEKRNLKELFDDFKRLFQG